MEIIEINIPYSLKEKKCALVVYVDEEAFDAMIKAYHKANVFSWNANQGKFYIAASFSHMILEDTWNIGGDNKSSVDQWRISKEIGVQGDIMEKSFMQLYERACGKNE